MKNISPDPGSQGLNDRGYKPLIYNDEDCMTTFMKSTTSSWKTPGSLGQHLLSMNFLSLSPRKADITIRFVK
ncbi:MAG: hypothetical protein KI790_00090 [Cyclobacteriaceae bacterium]|nr:hypothetical protein [Cyclobacteriaceae bacterium HetDA_MAG_MS6]